MTASVRELLTALIVGKKPDDFVFIREGSQLGNFRKTWENVCVAAAVGAFHCPSCDEVVAVAAADCPCVHCAREWGRSELKYRGLIFHDLRRCAVCGWIRAGVGQKTALSMTGHRTVNVFNRYAIVAPADKQEATRKLEISQEQERELLKSQATEFGQSLGRVARKTERTGEVGTMAAPPAILPN